VALIVDTAEAREVHHLCVLLGYGADAICPYMVFESARRLREEGSIADLSDDDIFRRYVDAVENGIAKVMAKMGISTLQSYKGAQIFEAVGLADDIVDKCFRGKSPRWDLQQDKVKRPNFCLQAQPLGWAV
jgi:glutamate synthase (NADH)